ncbi:MAG: hypothetical protein KDK41_12005 [Leptospiraceae bacterium]|nr:hypothetical protein [Leptospiraceae bacterium]
MTFNINFDNDVWKNQRRAIQKLGTTSVFYKLLKALLGPLLVRGDDLQSMLDETTIEDCPDDRLWVWGERLQIYRGAGESLTDYRYRLLEAKYISFGTLLEQLWIILLNSGLSEEQVQFERMPTLSVMGGTINTTMVERQRCFLSRRFFVPAGTEVDWDEIRAKLEQYLKGGEMFEIIEVAS